MGNAVFFQQQIRTGNHLFPLSSIGTYFAAHSYNSHPLYQEVLNEDSSRENPSGCPGRSSRSFFGYTVYNSRKFKRREKAECPLVVSRSRGDGFNSGSDLSLYY